MKKGCINRIVGLVPGYGWACFLILAACQAIVFCATRIPLQYMDKLDLSIPLDGRIPFRPEWITIYVLSFASWAITFLLLSSPSSCSSGSAGSTCIGTRRRICAPLC